MSMHVWSRQPCRFAPPGGREGFSLLEVLVATVILAAAMVVIVNGISSGQLAVAQMERRTAGYRMAANVLNRAAAGEIHDPPREATEHLGGAAYHWRLEVSADAESGLRELTCTVQWRVHGRDHRARLQRILCNLPDGGGGS